MQNADPRAWYDHVVDLNIFHAFDALLIKQRTDLLSYAGVVEGDRTGHLPSHQFVKFDVPLETGHLLPFGQTRRVGNFTRAEWEERFQPGQAFKPISVPKGFFRCAAWHINLSGIEAVQPYVVEPETKLPKLLISDTAGYHPLMTHRANLHSIVSQIDTSFKLTGPNNCSSEFLLESLYAAAFLLIREDYENQRKACGWLRNVGLKVSDHCGTFPGNVTLAQFPLDNVESESRRLPTGRIENEAVRCKRPSIDFRP
ncbi:hypothetical protein YTPLAS72_02510 [Nitrospira sp.]|nr:hypothetical protein YTPLAS72_02510 [Nitrospira sp.]